MLASVSCQAFWVIPERDHDGNAADDAALTNERRPAIAWLQPTAVPTPTPEADSEAATTNRIDFSSDAVQYWSNPNNIHDLLFDGQFLWAAIYGGLVRWSLEGEPTIFTVRDGLASQAVAALALDGHGRLWLGYEDVDGWTVREGDVWQHFETRREAVEMAYGQLLNPQRSHPQLWVGRPDSAWLWLARGDGSVQAYDGSRWRVYAADQGVTADSHYVGVSPGGQVWAVGRGISTAEEGELWWEDHTFLSEIEGAQDVTDVVVDGEGAVWISFAGEDRGGLTRYNPAVQRWEGHLAEINPAIPAGVHSLALDDDGTLWISGESRLSYRPPFRQFRTYDLGDVRALSFARDHDGHVWLGSDRGLYRLHLETEALEGPWVIPSPLPDNQITGLAIDGDGIVYVGTPRGISWIDAEGQTDLLSPQGVTWLGTDSTGQLWAASDQGLAQHLGEGDFTTVYSESAVSMVAFGDADVPYILTPDGLLVRWNTEEALTLADIPAWTGAMPRDMAVDTTGTVWLATAMGLGQLDSDGTRTVYVAGDTLLSEDARAVAVDVDDTIWIATASGLARRRTDDRWTRFTTESTVGGLRSMDMRDVSVGPFGDLWMATRAGISRRQPEEADWSYIDVPGAQQVLNDGRGALWVATGTGLYRIPADTLVSP